MKALTIKLAINNDSRMHPSHLSNELLLRECEVSTTRGSGPGGQHRNKTDTAVVVTHSSGIVGQASEARSQLTNRELAIFRLRLALATNYRTENGSPFSPAWQKWVRHGRIMIRESHADFPALLADAIDTFEWHEFEVAAAADSLSISSAQLLKLIRLHPAALHTCNQKRAQKGLHPLR